MDQEVLKWCVLFAWRQLRHWNGRVCLVYSTPNFNSTSVYMLCSCLLYSFLLLLHC
jgi:hypothetical protein